MYDLPCWPVLYPYLIHDPNTLRYDTISILRFSQIRKNPRTPCNVFGIWMLLLVFVSLDLHRRIMLDPQGAHLLHLFWDLERSASSSSSSTYVSLT